MAQRGRSRLSLLTMGGLAAGVPDAYTPANDAGGEWVLTELQAVYGDDLTVLDVQHARYRSALNAFERMYGPGPASVFRAPGRVNLIGEHTDYSQGYVLPVALDRDVLLVARAREDGQVRLANVESEFEPAHFHLSAGIPSEPKGHWSNYARGAAQLLAADYSTGKGMDGLLCGQQPWGIPRGAGLSSSSALTVVVALALSEFNGLALDRPTLAEACGRAEWYVGTRGGIMDQFASLLSERATALFLDCRPTPAAGEYLARRVPLPDGYAIVVVDSGVRHSNTGPLYNTRVAEVRAGVALLQERWPRLQYLRDLEGIPWDAYGDLLPERISVAALEGRGIVLSRLLNGGIIPREQELLVRSRCRHVVSENARVLEAVSALDVGDIKRFGALMSAAHASVRDDFGVSTPELETLIAAAGQIPGVAGTRLTGAGWGGCIVALVERTSVPPFVETIERSYHLATGLSAHAFVCQAGPGACRVIETMIQE
ncbi:MAG: galactokinase [Anaerolineae bacterium]